MRFDKQLLTEALCGLRAHDGSVEEVSDVFRAALLAVFSHSLESCQDVELLDYRWNQPGPDACPGLSGSRGASVRGGPLVSAVVRELARSEIVPPGVAEAFDGLPLDQYRAAFAVTALVLEAFEVDERGESTRGL